MLINFSNHSSEKWSDEQRKATRKWGDVEDLAFPNVSPYASEDDIEKLAQMYVDRIIAKKPDAVMVQGEPTLCYKTVEKLKACGIYTIAATTERVVETKEVNGETIKTSVFKFVRFREY